VLCVGTDDMKAVIMTPLCKIVDDKLYFAQWTISSVDYSLKITLLNTSPKILPSKGILTLRFSRKYNVFTYQDVRSISSYMWDELHSSITFYGCKTLI